MTSLRRGNFKLAYRSLKGAKVRSFLTMLGIVIGVMAVVLVVSIGQGVKSQISRQTAHYGKDILTVQPGGQSAGTNLLGSSGLSAASSLLVENDLRTVQAVGGVREAVPLATAAGSMRGDHTVSSPFIIATTADFPAVINQPIEYGGFFDPNADSQTVVLGQDVAHRLFDDTSPLGQTLTWRGKQFIVAGVYSSFNAPPFSLEANFNNAVFVPYSTAQKLSGSVLGIYQILVKASSIAAAPAVAHNVQTALTRQHGGSNDISVLTVGQSGSSSDQTIHLLTLLVTGVAIIALIVGGVGIMDVMLVSVTERMHEIGLRKALGATNRQILRQFMAEALVLSSIGAIIGLVASLAGIGLLRAFTSLQPVLVWQVLVLAPIVAVLVGVVFGTAPAVKAARKDPIEALRHE